MNADETKAAAAVMIAWAEGKRIQGKSQDNAAWHDYTEPAWNWNSFDYRIAPEPLEVEVWVHDDGRIVDRGYMGPMQASHLGFVPRRATIHPEEVKP